MEELSYILYPHVPTEHPARIHPRNTYNTPWLAFSETTITLLIITVVFVVVDVLVRIGVILVAAE